VVLEAAIGKLGHIYALAELVLPSSRRARGRSDRSNCRFALAFVSSSELECFYDGLVIHIATEGLQNIGGYHGFDIELVTARTGLM
jgi:hypothetical protein